MLRLTTRGAGVCPLPLCPGEPGVQGLDSSREHALGRGRPGFEGIAGRSPTLLSPFPPWDGSAGPGLQVTHER